MCSRCKVAIEQAREPFQTPEAEAAARERTGDPELSLSHFDVSCLSSFPTNTCYYRVKPEYRSRYTPQTAEIMEQNFLGWGATFSNSAAGENVVNLITLQNSQYLEIQLRYGREDTQRTHAIMALSTCCEDQLCRSYMRQSGGVEVDSSKSPSNSRIVRKALLTPMVSFGVFRLKLMRFDELLNPRVHHLRKIQLYAMRPLGNQRKFAFW